MQDFTIIAQTVLDKASGLPDLMLEPKRVHQTPNEKVTYAPINVDSGDPLLKVSRTFYSNSTVLMSLQAIRRTWIIVLDDLDESANNVPLPSIFALNN